MNKHLMSVSNIFLGICILLGSFFISQSLKSETVNKTLDEQFRYELISPNDVTEHIIPAYVLHKKTA